VGKSVPGKANLRVYFCDGFVWAEFMFELGGGGDLPETNLKEGAIRELVFPGNNQALGVEREGWGGWGVWCVWGGGGGWGGLCR